MNELSSEAWYRDMEYIGPSCHLRYSEQSIYSILPKYCTGQLLKVHQIFLAHLVYQLRSLNYTIMPCQSYIIVGIVSAHIS